LRDHRRALDLLARRSARRARRRHPIRARREAGYVRPNFHSIIRGFKHSA